MARLTTGSGHGTATRTPRLGALLVGTAVAFWGAGRPVAAQSEYHWSEQFGNKSTLLNGTVIGGVSDLGAVFYNPGRLAQLLRPGFLLTAQAFEVTYMEVKVGEGERNQVEQASLRGLPSLVSGMFTIPSLPGHRFAYSFLTRRRGDSNLLFTADERGDFLPSIPGEEHYLGTAEFVSKLDENWVGLTWATNLSSRWSLGVSTFGTYKGRRRRVEVDTRTLGENGAVSTFSRLREYRFASYGLLWKAGLAAEMERFRFGISVTTPEITPLGSGSLRYENLRIPSDGVGDDSAGSEVVVFREDGLEVTTHSPFSFGGGISWIRPRAEIHLSAEWYSGLSRYRILGVDSIPSQTSGEVLQYRVVDELEAVFNIGAGVELQVSDAFSAYGSIARDGSAASGDLSRPFAFGPKVSNSISTADGYFLGAGVSFQARWIDLTVGATFGATHEALDYPFSPGVPLEPPLLQDTSVGASRQRWRFLIGFSIPMVEEISDQPVDK